MPELLLLLAFEKSARGASLSGIFLFAFLLPFLIFIVINIVKSLSSKPMQLTTPFQPEHTPELEASASVQVTFVEEPQHKKPTREEQWKIIEEATMEKAMAGDKAARDWVTKHVFTDPVDPSTSQSDFTQDVVDALRPMGYKAADIKATVNELTRSKEYTSVDELIQDVIKSS